LKTIQYKVWVKLLINARIGSYLFFVLVGTTLQFTAHTQSFYVDSLENALSTTTISTDSIALMIELSKHLTENHPSKAMTYARKARRISLKSKDIKQEISAMFYIGILLYDNP
jgi:hypothetical protein